MISEQSVKQFCIEEQIPLIENYKLAIADESQTYDCHHRLEIQEDGTILSLKELKKLGLYYKRPAEELVFLTHSNHMMLHAKNRKEETRKKLSEAINSRTPPMKGHAHSDDAKRKISEALKGRTSPMKGRKHSEENKRKLSEANKGKKHKPLSDDAKRKISEAMKGRTHSDDAKQKMSAAKKLYWAKKTSRKINKI